MTIHQPKTIFVSGIFNVLHPGHLRLLRFAKQLGDSLVVGVLSDRLANGAATTSERDRLVAVQSLRVVDKSFIVDDSVTSAIRRLQPGVVVKGREHLYQENEEINVLDEFGGRLVFSSGDSFFSATDSIRNKSEGFEQPAIRLPIDFMAQNAISRGRLVELLERIRDVRVLVVGDSMVDEYISCHPLGMSREDPTLVVTPTETKSFVGGAAIVAAHAAGVGSQATLHTVTGRDAQGEFLANELNQYGVVANLYVDESRPTTTKQRWRASGKTLLRVSQFHQDSISVSMQSDILKAIKSQLSEHTVLIFSDFNYGALPQPLVEQLTVLGKRKEVTMAADSQSSSQIGDISRFRGVTLITPTEYEARVATRNFEDGLVVLADQLREQSQVDQLLMTLADDGVFVRGAARLESPSITAQLPALNRNPVDVSGAGDSFLVLASTALAVGASIQEAALLGSLAAALQVSAVGNAPLHSGAIRDLINQ